MSDFCTKGSEDCLRLQLTILTELSDDPTAITLELGWKLNDVIGDFENFYFEEIVQQPDSTL